MSQLPMDALLIRPSTSLLYLFDPYSLLIAVLIRILLGLSSHKGSHSLVTAYIVS